MIEKVVAKQIICRNSNGEFFLFSQKSRISHQLAKTVPLRKFRLVCDNAPVRQLESRFSTRTLYCCVSTPSYLLLWRFKSKPQRTTGRQFMGQIGQRRSRNDRRESGRACCANSQWNEIECLKQVVEENWLGNV